MKAAQRFASTRIHDVRRLLATILPILLFSPVGPDLRAQSMSEPTPHGGVAGPQPTVPANVPSTQTPPSPTGPGAVPGNPPAPTPQPTDLWQQNYLTGNWGGLRDQLKQRGVTLTPTYTADVFGNPSGGARQGAVYDGLFDVALDIDFDPLTQGAIKDTIFHAYGLYIHGSDLSTQIDEFSIVDNDTAYNSVRLQELWVQKLFFDKKLSVKIGNLPVDTEFFLSNSSSLFIAGTFGSFTLVANNITNPPLYPLGAPGIRLQVLPDPRVYVMAGVYGQDRNSNPATNNRSGTRFALDSGSGLLVMSEVGYLLNQGANDKGLQGTYRVGSFVDTSSHATFASQARAAAGTEPVENGGTNYGVYGVLDQQLFNADGKIVTLFVRSGSAPSNTNFVDWYTEGGCNVTGFVPGRANDTGGLAVGRSHISDDYSRAQVAQGTRPSTAETVIEATYKAQIAPWWTFQPDLQYVVTPSGMEGSRNALILGARTSITF